MKKICILICCCLLLQMLCSCSGKKEEFEDPVSFFYCNREIAYNSPTGVIQAETREGSGFQGNLTAFLNAYLRGPVSTELESPVPSDVSLVSCERNGDTVTIVLSAQFSKLTGIELSTACSALMMTVYDYTGAETLQVRAKDSQLDDKNEIVLGIDDIVLIDAAE